MQIRRRLKRNMRRALTTSLTPERSAPTTIANDLNSYGNLEHGLQQLDSSRGGETCATFRFLRWCLNLGIGVPLFHGCTAASNKLTPLIDDSRAIDETQMPLGATPIRLFSQPPHPWREVRGTFRMLLLHLETFGANLLKDFG